ncbi:MAG: CoA transferase, partial [Saprospiraceae bacterium]
ERQFRQLCACLDLENLLENPDFQTNTARVRNRKALVDVLKNKIAAYPLEVLLERFRGFGVPAARIRDMRGVFERPDAQAMVLTEMLDGVETKRVKTVAFSLSA